MTTTYKDKADSYLKSLDNLERQVDSRIGFKVDDEYVLGLKSRLDIIKTKIENTRQQFKKDVTKLVTKNIENKQNVVIKTWNKTEIDYPRISEMDEKIRMLNELKKMSQLSIPEKIIVLKNRLVVEKVNTRADKNSYLGRRNDILESLELIETSLKNNKILNDKSRKNIDQKLNNIQKTIDKLFLDFKTDFQKQYTKIMNSNKKSKMVKVYSSFYKISNSQPFIGSKTRIAFNNKKIPTIDKWDNIVSTLKTIVNKPTASNKKEKGISLLKKNYTLVPIKGDGSCQFRAVAVGMKELNKSINVENTTRNLRTTSINSLRNRLNNNFPSLKEQYLGLYKQSSKNKPKTTKRRRGNANNANVSNEDVRTMISSYLNKMKNSCEFGDMLTLAPLINLLKTRYNIGLVVFNNTPDSDDYYKFHLKQNSNNSQPENQKRYIYLLLTPETNKKAGHYDLLVKKTDKLNNAAEQASKLFGML